MCVCVKVKVEVRVNSIKNVKGCVFLSKIVRVCEGCAVLLFERFLIRVLTLMLLCMRA